MFPKTIEWKGDRVIILDQRRLPHQEVYLECTDASAVAEAIRTLAIRGAPAIGIAAAMGLALEAVRMDAQDLASLSRRLVEVCERLKQTRPTAVNLRWALERMRRALDQHENREGDAIKDRLVREALTMLAEDIETNKRIAEAGKDLIHDGDTVLTHCNTGSLATGGYGTALGIIRRAWKEKRFQVIATETRPLLQGARLTAWEIQREGIPVTLITDSMAGYLMQKGEIDLVMVGADRIACNGDVANKIGTYTLAVVAKEHQIPFYVAAPLSTFDASIQSGGDIPIEERADDEVTAIGGARIAPDDIPVRNPAFDVTPHRYVSAIITERGIIWPPFAERIRQFWDNPDGNAQNHQPPH